MNLLKLSNGVEIPHIGLGTYPIYGSQLTMVVNSAYQSGYSLIDTADNYYNEKDLGESLSDVYRKQNAKREDFFLVSKLSDELYPFGSIRTGNRGVYFWKTSPKMAGPNAVKRILNEKIENTLKYLRTDYLDLWLTHWPYPDFFTEIWYEMEQIYKTGKVRAIGVCNCRERHIEKLKDEGLSTPMVNQFETSPMNTKSDLVEYCDKNDIRIMVYSPLMSLRFRDETEFNALLQDLSLKYKKNAAQILLRFDVQRGLIPIPKSTNSQRLFDNINVFDFVLTEQEMQMLMGCNINRQTLPESLNCPGL